MLSQYQIQKPTRVVRPRALKEGVGIKDFKLSELDSLRTMGIGFDSKTFTQDSIQSTVTTPSIPVPLRFLQEIIPGYVAILTAARLIDTFIGYRIVGDWFHEQIVQGLTEMTGLPTLYNDETPVPLTNSNTNFVYRNVVRVEMGLKVGILESERTSAMNLSIADQKRKSVMLALEQWRNQLGWYGYNSGENYTYGFLNDPGNPAYIEVPESASGSTQWAYSTATEIISQLLTAEAQLMLQGQGNIDTINDAITLAVPTNLMPYLGQITPYGISVMSWIESTHRAWRVVSAPQLEGAYNGDNVFYLYADEISRDVYSTDDMLTWNQDIQTKFKLLGVSQDPKGYTEDFSMASAGVMLKRPYAVVRYYGI